MRKNICLLIILVFILGLFCSTGCETTRTTKGAGIGTAAGAAVGAIIGHQSDHRSGGAVIGGVVGGAVGALIGRRLDNQAKELEQVQGMESVKVDQENQKIEATLKINFDVDKDVINLQKPPNSMSWLVSFLIILKILLCWKVIPTLMVLSHTIKHFRKNG